MSSEGILVAIAELAIGIAGFSGVVVALGSRTGERWSPVTRIRMVLLLSVSLSAAMFSLLPLVLDEAGLTAERAWSISSGS